MTIYNTSTNGLNDPTDTTGFNDSKHW